MIAAAARRGAELTRRLLAFARKQPLEPRETDINALIINAQKLFRPSLGEHIEIETCLDENAWPALVDPTQLTTALLNLAVNARDAMPKGGKLSLETRNVALDEKYSRAYTEVTPGDYVRIAVSDTGGGIPASIRDKVDTEFMILEALAQRPGVVKSRNQLLDVAYSDDVYVDDRTIDSHIKRIRRKFRAAAADFDAIETLYGVGYRFDAD